ncbi:hypothetical protein Taro_020045 [Colocasia esculenta]|uniref:Uncharacterized protein n=1 Tax=Colocasia esculenta TaxID=4460 RepID=A0A843UML7_COLES|nr:hypothetical protein [Colocasia esculenta]
MLKVLVVEVAPHSCRWHDRGAWSEEESFVRCSAPEGLSRERGCYSLPGTPVLMHLRGSVRGDECTRVADSGVEGKMVVRLLSRGRVRTGRRRRGGSRDPHS